MTGRRCAVALVLLALAGCANSPVQRAAALRPATGPVSPAVAANTPVGGAEARGAATAGRPAVGPGPSASARMVCSAEIRSDVSLLAGISAAPPRTERWAPPVYSCTYQLPAGPLVVSVREDGSHTTALRLLDAGRRATSGARLLPTLQSLGLPAYSAPDGTVVFAKDDKTLTVDPSHLPTQVGPSSRSRADLAYTLATDVLGCWSGK